MTTSAVRPQTKTDFDLPAEMNPQLEREKQICALCLKVIEQNAKTYTFCGEPTLHMAHLDCVVQRPQEFTFCPTCEKAPPQIERSPNRQSPTCTRGQKLFLGTLCLSLAALGVNILGLVQAIEK